MRLRTPGAGQGLLVSRSFHVARCLPIVLAAGDGADDQKGFFAGGNLLRQRGIGWLKGDVLLASEETQERPALFGDVVSDRPLQHGIGDFERVKDGALRYLTLDLELQLAARARQRSQVRREDHSDHGSVWTSTDRTAGRSRTIGDHVSPALAEPYTWPPVVPK